MSLRRLRQAVIGLCVLMPRDRPIRPVPVEVVLPAPSEEQALTVITEQVRPDSGVSSALDTGESTVFDTGPVGLAPPPQPEPALAEDYQAERPKTILDLQQFRQSASRPIRLEGHPDAWASLVDLNPGVGTWYLLGIQADPKAQPRFYHLEDNAPGGEPLVLTEDGVGDCALWSGGAASALERARRWSGPYAPLCGGRLSLRNPVEGRRSKLEWATDFLRDNVWGGEQITVFVRDQVLKDRYLQTGELQEGQGERLVEAHSPRAPALDAAHEGARLPRGTLGLPLEDQGADALIAGQWYAVSGVEGAYASVIQPRLVSVTRNRDQPGRLHPTDSTEAQADVYVVAFDLERFSLGFALGTDHPRVGWSERVLPPMVDPNLPGPDGIDSAAPLVRTGMVNPAQRPDLIATFVAGFKRAHGAFKAGELAHENSGSHYGFIEQGVVFSKLQPGLATLVVWVDGRVEIVEWSEAMNGLLGTVRFARQNGVPILQRDPLTGAVEPGGLVTRWAEGNWSGSADGRLRTLRSGACIQRSEHGSFLLYAWFSGATPSVMARVMGAYGCGTAMPLDMNALEHTYLAVYPEGGVRHLVDGMEVLDRESKGTVVPRFVGMSDNRDFFYLVRR